MTDSLKVNTDELRGAAATFTAAGDKLATMEIAAPLGDAASSVPALQTAGACAAAEATVAEQLTALAGAVRTYGANVAAAAAKYESTDRSAGGSITAVEIPAPGSS